MNIFYFSPVPEECAKALCDKHVVKMIVESTQLLCNAYPENSFSLQYKRTHYNHPCSVWVRESIQNFAWLLEYTENLCKEYTYRYGKSHACEAVLNRVNNSPWPDLPPTGKTVPPQVMPEEFKHPRLTRTSYKSYYHHKAKTMKSFCYTNRTPPDWLEIENVKTKRNFV